jgi:group I intron endonuclease
MVIYKTTNIINNKIYVGKSIKEKNSYIGSGVLLNRAIKKYGKNNFIKEIIDRANTLDELNEKEIYWIEKLNSTDQKIGYNITKGGTGGDTLSNHPNELKIRKKMRESLDKIQKTSEHRKKTSENFKKIWKREGYREKMAGKMKGRKITWKDKIRESVNAYYAENGPRKVSEETKLKIVKNRKSKFTVKIPDDIQNKIVSLYKDFGASRISEILLKENNQIVSRFLIIRVLKEKGLYKKNCKGLKFLKNNESV